MGLKGYLFGGARDQALVQPLGLLLRESLGLVVPHQSSLDLDERRIRSSSLSPFKCSAESSFWTVL